MILTEKHTNKGRQRINLDCSTHMNLRVELDQEAFPFEAQLANLGPVEGVYFCVALEEEG